MQPNQKIIETEQGRVLVDEWTKINVGDLVINLFTKGIFACLEVTNNLGKIIATYPPLKLEGVPQINSEDTIMDGISKYEEDTIYPEMQTQTNKRLSAEEILQPYYKQNHNGFQEWVDYEDALKAMELYANQPQQPIDFIHGTDLVSVKELLDRGYQMAMNEVNSKPTPHFTDEKIEKMAEMKYPSTSNTEYMIRARIKRNAFSVGFKHALSLTSNKGEQGRVYS